MANLVVLSEEDLKRIISDSVADALNNSEDIKRQNSKFGTPEKRFMNIDELSKFLGIPKNTLYQYNHQGKISYIYRFKKVLYDWEVIQEWLKEGSVKLKTSKK